MKNKTIRRTRGGIYGRALARHNLDCRRLSGRLGFGDAAILRGLAVHAFELSTGRRVSEPSRSLWLAQADLERATVAT